MDKNQVVKLSHHIREKEVKEVNSLLKITSLMKVVHRVQIDQLALTNHKSKFSDILQIRLDLSNQMYLAGIKSKRTK